MATNTIEFHCFGRNELFRQVPTVLSVRDVIFYSSGLPPDITTEEFVEVMSKCGIVMRDPISEEYKVKLYRDGQGNQKGDGLCCYLKVSALGLALSWFFVVLRGV